MNSPGDGGGVHSLRGSRKDEFSIQKLIFMSCIFLHLLQIGRALFIVYCLLLFSVCLHCLLFSVHFVHLLLRVHHFLPVKLVHFVARKITTLTGTCTLSTINPLNIIVEEHLSFNI